MRFLVRFYTIVLVIVLTVLFMVMFFIIDGVRMMDANENLNYLPNNTVFVARINTSSLLKLTANDLIETKDQDILDQMKDLNLESGKNPFNGINFASNIYFFIIPHENEFVEGMIFNLSDKEAFQEYYIKLDKYPSSANEKVGVILLKELNNLNDIEAGKLKLLCEDIIEKPQNEELNIDFSLDESIISTWSTDPTHKLPFSNNLKLDFYKDKITLTGNLSMFEELHPEFVYLKKKGISIATSMIPNEVNDSINRFLNRIGYNDTLLIHSFSANYNGVNFDQTDKLSINPQIEVLLNFDQALNWSSLANQLIDQKYIRQTDSSNYVFSEISFTITQPTERQLLISNGLMASEQEVRNELFEFSGNPSLLFKVGGNSPYGQFLNLIPMFRSGRILTNATESASIRIIPDHKNQYKVEGTLKFKEGHSPTVELIKFLNSSALLK